MKRKKNQGFQFLWGTVILLFVFGPILFGTPKGIFEIQFNRLHQPFLDTLFVALTRLGDGVVFLPVGIFFLFRKITFSIFLGLCGLFNLVFVAIFKKLLFPGTPRPIEFLKGLDFYQVPGIDIHHWNSFPSGHTTTAFSLAFALAIIYSKYPKIQQLMLILAVGIGLSRVYLMQHFFIDIWAGAALGLVATQSAKEITLRYFSNKKLRKPLFQSKTPRFPALRRRVILQQKWVG